MVASIGRRTIDPITGLSAALFLALDSNFLGGVRSARTDIPSVFFVVAAFAAYIRGRERSQTVWFVCAGASLGLAMLCHGNAFWAGVILLAWYLLDYGRRALVAPDIGYAVIGGLLLTFGPYLAVVLVRWADVQLQIGNFAADRVPGWRPVVRRATDAAGGAAVSRLVFRVGDEHGAEPVAVGVPGRDRGRHRRARVAERSARAPAIGRPPPIRAVLFAS